KAVEMNKERRHQSMEELWRALSGREPTWSYVAVDAEASEETSKPGQASVDRASAEADLSFGRVRMGRRATRKLTLPPGEGGKLVPRDAWLRVKPEEVELTGGEAELTVDTKPLEAGRLEMHGGLLRRWLGWHTSRLVPTKRVYESYVSVERDSGQQDKLSVSVVVTPEAWKVGFGWFMTLTAMLIELGLPALTVVALLYS
ncbi:MAG: hypothetical protein ACP5JG_17390, partial [Anaerolineae bacterium]